MKNHSSLERILVRGRDAAEMLGVSETQFWKWQRAGVIRPVEIPGIRAKRYLATDVRSLAANIAKGKLSSDPAA